MVVGGNNNGGNLNTIYKYDPVTGRWVLQPQRLPFHNHYHTALAIDREEFGKIE